MIYRVVGESSVWVWSEESGAMEVSPGPGRLIQRAAPEDEAVQVQAAERGEFHRIARYWSTLLTVNIVDQMAAGHLPVTEESGAGRPVAKTKQSRMLGLACQKSPPHRRTAHG